MPAKKELMNNNSLPKLKRGSSSNGLHKLRTPVPLLLFIICGSVLVGVLIGKIQLRNYAGVSKIQEVISMILSSTNTQVIDANLHTYINEKFGFSIKYPSRLNLKPTEADIKADNEDYMRKCDSGELDGCGGGRWPDYKVSFMRPNGKAAFDVRIYQKPVSKDLGGIEHDNFTYQVSTFRYSDEDIEVEPVDEDMLTVIEKSLQFVKPINPLACLWDIDRGAIFDPIKDKKHISDNKDLLTPLTGYYYSSDNDTCYEAMYFTWKGQEDADKLPFTSKENCLSTCNN